MEPATVRAIKDETHQLLDVSIEGECLCHGCRSATARLELFLSGFSLLELSQCHTNKDPSTDKQPHIPFRMPGGHGTGMAFDMTLRSPLALTGHRPLRPLHLCTFLGPQAC